MKKASNRSSSSSSRTPGQLAELSRLADVGDPRVLVDTTFPLDRAQDAFDRLQSGNAVGKVVLAVHD
jgi:NADPH:quinone reductase-like Zn-dependent oxidoreductase